MGLEEEEEEKWMKRRRKGKEGSTWVSYDNPQSFAAKGSFAVSYDLRGVFVWDIDEDDKNVLILSAVKALNGTEVM